MDARALNRRYETIAWGAFFIVLGATSLVPGTPSWVGTLGIAFVLLGLNLARYLAHLPTSAFTVLLGSLALVFGVADLLRTLFIGVEIPFFPLLLILIGIIWLIRGVTRLS